MYIWTIFLLSVAYFKMLSELTVFVFFHFYVFFVWFLLLKKSEQYCLWDFLFSQCGVR
nr:hypothetical protein B11C_180021 [Bartonella sp. 1-1C]